MAKKEKKNYRLLIDQQRKDMELQMKEYEILRDLQKLRAEHHPTNYLTKIADSDFIKKQNLTQKFHDLAEDPAFSDKMNSAQGFFGDLFVYIASYFASDKVSKLILKKNKKNKKKAFDKEAQLDKIRDMLQELQEKG